MNAEAAARLSMAKENIRIARVILEHGAPAIAASRAYYAMFYVAGAWLLSLGRTYSSHQSLIAAFGRDVAHPGRVPIDQHRHLIEAFADRHTADYDDPRSVSPAQAERLIVWAEEMLRTAEENLPAAESES